MKGDRNWDILLKCVGEDALCKVLLNRILLCKLNNGSYYQLSGDQLKGTLKLEICEHAKIRSDPLILVLSSNIGQKRPSDNSTKLSRRQKKKIRLANEAWASKENRNKKKQTFSKKKINQSISRADMFYSHVACDPDTNKQSMGLPGSHVLAQTNGKADQSVLLSYMEQIFPNEFRNSLKKKKLLKRLEKFPDVLSQIAVKHRRKRLFFLMDSRCPKRVTHTDIDNAASSHKEVTQFVIGVLSQMFPRSFWGSADNLQAICNSVKAFVNRHTNENVDLKEILSKFKVKDCRWLAPPDNPAKIVITDILRRKELLEQAMIWLFNDYLKPILRHTFHITEHAKHSKRVFYFRKDVWNEITESSLKSIKASSFTSLEYIHEASLKPMGVGKLRLIPKKSGFRPIINMRHTSALVNGRPKVGGSKIDTRKVLNPVLEVLNSEKQNNPSLVGSSILGKQLFHEKLKNYKEKNCANGKKFFFVKADIENCFESIDQVKLLDILREVLGIETQNHPSQTDAKKKIYLHRDVNIFQPGRKSMVPKVHTSMDTAELTKHISEEAMMIPNVPSGSIIVDKSTYYKNKAQDLYDLLEKSISNNIVQIGNEYHKRVKGITQGSVLSTLLCSFFFGSFEKKKLAPILDKDTEGVLFSYVDDYLYITTNVNKANWFKNTILYELPKFAQALSINKEKTCSNLTEDFEDFTWLGYRINCQTLDVSLHQPENLANMKDSITTQYILNPGQAFYTSCMRDIKSKMYPILMDTTFNSKETVSKNLYDNFRAAAIKLESRTANIAQSELGFINQQYICTVIVQIAINIIPAAPIGITANEMMTEYFKAFHLVYQRKQTSNRIKKEED
ncbi:unnamed protein product [Mucor hiemalis]